MSSLPGPRTCPFLAMAGIAILASVAVVAALMPGAVLLGASMGGVAASAELAAGAALHAGGGWVVPALFSVMVFALVVGATAVLLRAPVSLPGSQRSRRSGPSSRARPGPLSRTEFALRQPDRALGVRIDRLPGITD
ncbi:MULTISPECIES: hypothetical protein [unclassified Dietzia]|uniref:hypothetical protein n=1 Tax=unclassified Dietzia TaxID=2617939 RepID=UPI000D1FF541|nr:MULTISPECIES: hypothetical protein [unclassified Dietzia]AVZ40245.1 hypothetical protein CT688_12985 [Dietzia sp. JS16-p6b]QGW25710.1 hypothetical protein GJR88_04124 [Dietzia sp. DQ12-45-1b]